MLSIIKRVKPSLTPSLLFNTIKQGMKVPKLVMQNHTQIHKEASHTGNTEQNQQINPYPESPVLSLICKPKFIKTQPKIFFSSEEQEEPETDDKETKEAEEDDDDDDDHNNNGHGGLKELVRDTLKEILKPIIPRGEPEPTASTANKV